MTAQVQRLWRCGRGAAMMEFGLLTPVIASFIIAAIELGMVFLVTNSLQNAVLSSSRYGITGQSEEGITRKEKIVEVVSENTFGLINLDEMIIETIVYDSFSNVGKPEPFADANGNEQMDSGEEYTDINGNGQWDPDMGVAGLGGPGDIVLYRINFTIRSMTGLFEPVFGSINHSAAVAVRNEPF